MLIRKLRSLEKDDKFTYNEQGYKVMSRYDEHSDTVWCKNLNTGSEELLRGKLEVGLGYHKEEKGYTEIEEDDYDLDR